MQPTASIPTGRRNTMYTVLPVAMELSDYVGIVLLVLAAWIFVKALTARMARSHAARFPEGRCPKCGAFMQERTQKYRYQFFGLMGLAELVPYKCPKCHFRKLLWCVTSR